MKIQRRNNLLCVFDVTNLKMRVGGERERERNDIP